MGFVGRGRIITEERVEPCGVATLWHVVLFADDAVGCEREVGRSIDFAYADAIKARWEKETCAVFGDAPIKHSETGMNAARNRKKPQGRDLRQDAHAKNSLRDTRRGGTSTRWGSPYARPATSGSPRT